MVVTLATSAAATPALFDYKALDGDSANYAFINRFSDSRVFHCYKNGKMVFEMGVGIPFKGETGQEIASQYLKKYGTAFDWSHARDHIEIEIGIKTSKGYQTVYVSAGKPFFDSNESAKYMVVELLNGKKVEFTRFGPIPDFPFNTKQKLKPFFYYQVAGEPKYECGAIDQPN